MLHLNERSCGPNGKRASPELTDRLLANLKMEESTVVGVCHDICPKKEREFRIKHKLWSSFELSSDNKPDESRMIKEYRRSAADQDELKPAELRTEEGKRV